MQGVLRIGHVDLSEQRARVGVKRVGGTHDLARKLLKWDLLLVHNSVQTRHDLRRVDLGHIYKHP